MINLNKILYRITPLDKLLFSKHLAVMLKSGIPIAEAIFALKEQTTNLAFKEVLEKIYIDINNGQTLEKALSKHTSVFDSLYLSMVSTGEKSGSLEENLEFLSTQLRKSYEFNKKINAATLYPKLVLLATFIMGGSISLFVLPQLTTLFTSLDIELPLHTKILLIFSNIMKNFGLFIIGGFLLGGIFIKFLLQTPPIKPSWHLFLLKVPNLGKLIANIELTNICRNLGIMLKSGLTLSSALETQYQSENNLVFKEYLNSLKKSLEKGKKLSSQMSSSKFEYMPSIVTKMIQVGEETGKLEDVLIYLGDFFEEEADDQTKNLSNVIEPILLLVIGAVVGFVALAIITPIYSLTGSIRK